MKVRGIMLQRLRKKILAFVILSMVVLCIMAMDSVKNFKKMEEATNQYIICEQAAEELLESSEYLEEEILLYVDTGDRKYLLGYFEEATVARRQENAIAIFEQYFHGTDTLVHIEEALSHSEDLKDMEYHAMKLVALSYEQDFSEIPSEITEYPLSEEEEHLSRQEMIATAIHLVTGDAYQDSRENIMDAVNRGVDGLLASTDQMQKKANANFIRSFSIIIALILLLALCTVALIVIMLKKVVEPLEVYNECISSGTTFPVIGAVELKNLAITYNRVFVENEENEKLLRHEAEHDAMTGIFNKGSFTRLMDIYGKSKTPYALILIDVDNFKTFNDTYGHEVGDKVLIKVASSLKRAFRSTVYPCRIGGDEFALIMIEMDSDLKAVLIEKLTSIQKFLKNPEDGLPPITLSIGVAFSDRENPQGSIFNDADAALYEVKKRGRDGYQVF